MSACLRSRVRVPKPDGVPSASDSWLIQPRRPRSHDGMTDLSPLDGGDTWDITVVSEPFTTGSEDVETAVGRLQDQARQRNWDLVVGLTELPLHDHEGRHLLVETDPEQRTAVLSLPALGGFRMHARARRAVRSLVSGMADPNTKDEHRVALPRVRGRWRLLLGMVLANRPWLLVPGLKSALVAALATGAVATINSTVWLLAASLSWWRLVVATIASVALAVAWLVIDGELWDRPDDDSPQARERSRLYNASTLVTLMAGVLICYAALYAVNLAWAYFVARPRCDGQLSPRPARLRGPVRPGLVRRVCRNRRRWPRLRPGSGRGDTRRHVLQARAGPARPPRAATGTPSNPPSDGPTNRPSVPWWVSMCSSLRVREPQPPEPGAGRLVPTPLWVYSEYLSIWGELSIPLESCSLRHGTPCRRRASRPSGDWEIRVREGSRKWHDSKPFPGRLVGIEGMDMHSYELVGMRRRLDEGEPLDSADQRRLVDAMHELTRAARLPSEFVVRVHRDTEATGWSAEHPLFLTSGSSPASRRRARSRRARAPSRP